MRLTLALFGATIVDLHIRDDDPDLDEPEELERPSFGYGTAHSHTELAGVQVEPLTEGAPYDE